MKKVLLSLLAVAALVLSCQNYDDEFAALNSKIADLEGQLGTLASIQTTVNQLQTAVSAIPGLAAELDSIQAAIDKAATSADIEALQAELNSLIAANADAIEANADVLQANGLDIEAILGTVSTYEDNLTINDAATLAFAKALGRKVRNIKGNVTIDVSANDMTAAQVAEVSKLIVAVQGDVLLTNDSDIDDSPIDVSALTNIKGNYSVVGWDANDDALTTITGDLTTDYGQAVLFPNLTSVGGDITIKNVAVAAATASTKAITGVTALNLVNVKGGAATQIRTDALGFDVLSLPVATSVKVGDIEVSALTADLATEVELHFDGTIVAGLDLDVDKAATIISLATQITGAIDVDQLATGSIELPNVTTFGAGSDFTGVSFKADKLATITGAMVANAVTSLSLPAAALSSSTISATAATSFVAPKLVAGGAITIKAGGTISLASAATGDLGSLATLTGLTLSAQDEPIVLTAGVELITVSVTGKTSSSDVTLGGALVDLTTLSFAGKNGLVIVGTDAADGLDKLTSFTTSGTMESLTVFHAKALTSINMGHTADATEGSMLEINGNDKLASLTTSFDHAFKIVVTDNGALADMDFATVRTLPLAAVVAAGAGNDKFEFTIADNFTTVAPGTLASGTGLKGAYQPLTQVDPLEFHQNSLLTLAPYIATLEAARAAGGALAGLPAANAAAVNGAEFVLSLDYQIANGAAATQKLSAAYGTAIVTVAEVAKIKSE